jgi:hypothetical protein
MLTHVDVDTGMVDAAIRAWRTVVGRLGEGDAGA